MATRACSTVPTVVFSLFFSIAAFAVPEKPNRYSSVPSAGDSSAGGSCCFCVYPNSQDEDSDTLRNLCESCLPIKYPNCAYRASVPASGVAEAVRSHGCQGRIEIMNAQHGPTPLKVVELVEVCQRALPGCHLAMNDLSCSTFESDSVAQAVIQSIQNSLPDGAIVDICGSGSKNLYAGCTFYRTTKRYVVSPAFSAQKLGICPRFGDGCDHSVDGGKPFRCVDTLGREQSITCCPMSEPDSGYWGNSRGCRGKGCTTESCPAFQMCEDDTWRKQECTKDGACIKFSFRCSEINRVCGTGKTGPECISPPEGGSTSSPPAN